MNSNQLQPHQRYDFFDAYPDARKWYVSGPVLELNVLALCGLMILSLFGSIDLMVFTYGMFALVLLWAFCLKLPKQYNIRGNPDVLTVLDGKEILEPSDSIQLRRFPRSVHFIPLQGAKVVEFEIDELHKFSDLEIYIPELERSKDVKNVMRVKMNIAWHLFWKRAIYEQRGEQLLNGLHSVDSVRFNQRLIDSIQINSFHNNFFYVGYDLVVDVLDRAHWEIPLNWSEIMAPNRFAQFVMGALKERALGMGRGTARLIRFEVTELNLELIQIKTTVSPL